MKGTRIVFSRNLNKVKFNALDEQAQLLGKIRSNKFMPDLNQIKTEKNTLAY
jgi:hypothetical protein